MVCTPWLCMHRPLLRAGLARTGCMEPERLFVHHSHGTAVRLPIPANLSEILAAAYGGSTTTSVWCRDAAVPFARRNSCPDARVCVNCLPNNVWQAARNGPCHMGLLGTIAVVHQFVAREANQAGQYTEADSETSRYELWRAARAVFVAHPVLGVGSRRSQNTPRDMLRSVTITAARSHTILTSKLRRILA